MIPSPISLAPLSRCLYSTGVRPVVQLFALLTAVFLVSCGKKESVVEVSEVRAFMNDDEMLKFYVPREWKQTGATIPGMAMRTRRLNYQFGETGEIYLSLTKGDLLGNANRWLGQFGVDPKTNLGEFESIPVLESKAVFLEQYGIYTQTKKDWGMLGALMLVEGDIVAIKMLGRASEVKAQKENFKKFCLHYNKYKVATDEK